MRRSCHWLPVAASWPQTMRASRTCSSVISLPLSAAAKDGKKLHSPPLIAATAYATTLLQSSSTPLSLNFPSTRCVPLPSPIFACCRGPSQQRQPIDRRFPSRLSAFSHQTHGVFLLVLVFLLLFFSFSYSVSASCAFFFFFFFFFFVYSSDFVVFVFLRAAAKGKKKSKVWRQNKIFAPKKVAASGEERRGPRKGGQGRRASWPVERTAEDADKDKNSGQGQRTKETEGQGQRTKTEDE